MRRQPLALPAALLLALTACTRPYNPPVVDPAGAHFPGLLDLLADMPGEAKALDVYVVHGMCTHDKKWVDATFDGLAEHLGALAAAPARTAVTRLEGGAIEIHPRTFALPQGTLNAYAVVWSPLTASHKKKLCYDQTTKSELCEDAEPYRPTRARLNAALKDTLLNDCLADAIIYQGASRSAIVEAMQNALTHLAASRGGVPPAVKSRDALVRAAAANDTPLVVITESLGSKVVYDAIHDMQAARHVRDRPGLRAIGASIFARNRQVFMLANQIPMLALADLPPDRGAGKAAPAETRFPPDPLAALLAEERARKETRPPRTLVAFTDPNDQLSYLLRPAGYGDAAATVDVQVSNAPAWLGLFANPWSAHTGYGATTEVMEKVVCGHPRSVHCR